MGGTLGIAQDLVLALFSGITATGGHVIIPGSGDRTQVVVLRDHT